MGKKYKSKNVQSARIRNSKTQKHNSRIPLILFTVIVPLLLVVTLQHFFPGKQPGFLPQEYLFARADALKKLVFIRDNAKAVIKFELLSPYIDQDLRQAQDKYHSILQQTRIYEDICSRNQGNCPPENFIAASLSALKDIESRHLSSFKSPVRKCYALHLDPFTQRQMIEHKSRLKEIEVALGKFHNLANFIQNCHSNPNKFYDSIPFGIKFHPDGDGEIQMHMSNITAMEVANKLQSVAEDLVQLSKAQDVASSYLKWFRPTVNVAKIQRRIAKKVADEGHYYKLTQHFHIQLHAEADKLLQEIETATERKQSLFIHLGKLLIKQVRGLMSRVKRIGNRS